MAAPVYQSLDETGTQAAVYPSEDVLWAVGPQINDPGGQGVVSTGPPTITPAQLQATEDMLHEQLNGETSNEVWTELWVNTQEYGPTGYGPYVGEDQFQSGHTQITVSNPSAEQGWGVGPARRWAHYPIEQNVNPFRNRMVHCRNGALPWVTQDSYLYERTQLAWEQQWDPYKRRSPVTPIVPVSHSVPFSQTVPTYAGGPQGIAGVDYPDDGDSSMLYG